MYVERRKLGEEVLTNLGELVHVDGTLPIQPAHHHVCDFVLVWKLLPPRSDHGVPVLAIEVRVCLLDFWDLISPVEPIGRHESQFACGLDRAVVAAVLDLVDLLSELADSILDLFVPCVVALFALVCDLVVRLPLLVRDSIAPFLLEAPLDLLGAQVRHRLLDCVEVLVFENLVGCLGFLGQGAKAYFKLEISDLGLLSLRKMLQGKRLGTMALID